MNELTEDQVRTAIAWLKAHATRDDEAIKVLTEYSDLERLATDLAEVALFFISTHGDPVQRLDLMFHAVGAKR